MVNKDFIIIPIDYRECYDKLSIQFPEITDGFLTQKEHLDALMALMPSLIDVSFIISSEKFNLSLLFLGFKDDQSIGLSNWPAMVFPSTTAMSDNGALLGHMMDHLKSFSVAVEFFLKWPNFENNKELQHYYFNMLNIDLKRDEAALYSQIRKSYRSLINWGKKNLNIEIYSAETTTSEKFRTFADYYDLISQHPKPELYWSQLHTMVKNGHGYFLLSSFAGNLVSATLVLHGKKSAYYALGAYDKNLMKSNKPLAHWPILKSVLEAKERGLQTFEMGYFRDSDSEKENNITKFKSGFTHTTQMITVFRTIPVNVD